MLFILRMTLYNKLKKLKNNPNIISLNYKIVS